MKIIKFRLTIHPRCSACIDENSKSIILLANHTYCRQIKLNNNYGALCKFGNGRLKTVNNRKMLVVMDNQVIIVYDIRK